MYGAKTKALISYEVSAQLSVPLLSPLHVVSFHMWRHIKVCL